MYTRTKSAQFWCGFISFDDGITNKMEYEIVRKRRKGEKIPPQKKENLMSICSFALKVETV